MNIFTRHQRHSFSATTSLSCWCCWIVHRHRSAKKTIGYYSLLSLSSRTGPYLDTTNTNRPCSSNVFCLSSADFVIILLLSPWTRFSFKKDIFAHARKQPFLLRLALSLISGKEEKRLIFLGFGRSRKSTGNVSQYLLHQSLSPSERRNGLEELRQRRRIACMGQKSPAHLRIRF